MPSNLQAFLLLLFFIAPGFLFSQAYQYGRPRYYREPNVFRQTLSTLIASTLIHALFLTLFSVIALAYTAISGASFLPVGDALNLLQSCPADELVKYFVILASYSVISLLVGWRGGLFWQGVMTSEVPRWYDKVIDKVIGPGEEDVPLWWVLIGQAYIRNKTRGLETSLRIRLRNGDECTGNIDRIRWVGEKDIIFELILRDVSYIRTTQTDAFVSEEENLPDHRLLLLSSDILWLSRIDLPQKKFFI